METPIIHDGGSAEKARRYKNSRGLRHRRPSLSSDRAIKKTLHVVATALSDTSKKLMGEHPDGMLPLDDTLFPHEKGRKAIQANIRELRYTMIFWTIIGAIMFFYFTAVPYHDIKILHGYPKYAIRAPGDFVSNRYGYEWAMAYILWWNFLPIVLAIASIGQMNMPSRADIHYGVSWIVIVLNTIVFASLSFIWLFYINTGSTVDSMGSDDQSCGIYFSSTRGVKVCPNVMECPDLTRSDLCRSGPFFQLWLFSILFSVWIFYIMYMNKRVRTYGGWTLLAEDNAPYDSQDESDDHLQ